MRLFGTPTSLKRMVPRGLLGRSLLILVVPLVVLQVVTSVVFYERHWDTVMRRLASGLAGDIAATLSLLHRYPDPDGQRWVTDFAQEHFELQLDFKAGEVLPNDEHFRDALSEELNDSQNEDMEDVLAQSLSERLRRPVMVDMAIFARDIDIYVQRSDGILHITAPRKRLFSSTTYIFVLWMAGTAMLLFGIATIFMSNQVRSIRRLAVSADGFGKGRDLPPIKVEGAREVRQAAQAFNLMRERIQRQVAQRTEMLAGVSHDLRTPLTRMKLQLAMMGDSPDACDLSEDVAEMERMVEGYLAFARGEGTESASDVDLVEVLETVVARFQRDERCAVELVGLYTASGERRQAPTTVRRDSIERCLSNLIGNACRYGQRVRVHYIPQEDEESCFIVVEDDGPGIPPALREEVFRPFFRADSSRNSQTGGTGLGLTIARDAARVHGGDILLDDSQEMGGLRVTLHLPL